MRNALREQYDRKYEATREDVLYAVGPVEPNPLSGPDDPDPFGHNERPWTEYMIATRIDERNNLGGGFRPSDVIKMNRLRELLSDMATEGSIVGLPRRDWASMGREFPSRAGDIMYASVEHTARWKAEAPRVR